MFFARWLLPFSPFFPLTFVRFLKFQKTFFARFPQVVCVVCVVGFVSGGAQPTGQAAIDDAVAVVLAGQKQQRLAAPASLLFFAPDGFERQQLAITVKPHAVEAGSLFF